MGLAANQIFVFSDATELTYQWKKNSVDSITKTLRQVYPKTIYYICIYIYIQ